MACFETPKTTSNSAVRVPRHPSNQPSPAASPAPAGWVIGDRSRGGRYPHANPLL